MAFLKSFVVVPLLQLLTGCAITSVGTDTLSDPRATIPTHAFASNSAANFAYKISPDGKKLAWIAVKGTALALHIKDLDTARIVTRPAPALEFKWTEDSRRLITDALAQTGSENAVVGVISALDDGTPMAIVSIAAGASSRLVSQVTGDDDHVLVESNRRDHRVFDLFKVDLRSKKHVLLAENDGFTRTWLATVGGEFAGRIVVNGDRHALQIRQPGSQAYVSAYQWSDDDEVAVLSISPDFSTTYLLSNKERDLSGLLRVDNASGKIALIHADPLVDVSAVYTDPATATPLLAVSEPDYPKNTLLDDRLAPVLSYIAPKLPARMAIENADRRVSKFVFSLANDTGKEFYLADLDTGSIAQVGVASTQRFRAALRASVPIQFPSRDGTLLRGYLTLPERHGDGLPPLVVTPHGGPWARDVWGYDALAQFLANRGYAVLALNFRGSAGYGRKFQALGRREGGGKMQDDLYDGIAWAGVQGLVAPGKAASMGYSYGGYATMMSLVGAPGMVACGIAINGPIDLPDLVENLPATWAFDRAFLRRNIGDPGNPDARASMLLRSPIALAATLKRPLLLVQGADDVRVNPAKASAFAQAANLAGRKVEFWSIPHQGHAFTDWRNTLRLYRKSEKFLAACIGGRDAGFDYYELGYFLP